MTTRKIELANELMQSRKSVYPQHYTERAIPREILEQILENADRAPSHRLTEPWRFRVIRGAERQRFSTFLAAQYDQLTPPEKQSDFKRKRLLNKPLQSDTVITISMQRDPDARVPEWEEIASVAMAVQNIYLSCTAYGIGCYWSSHGSIKNMSDFHAMGEGERCLGILYMGYTEAELPVSTHRSLEEKVVWIE